MRERGKLSERAKHQGELAAARSGVEAGRANKACLLPSMQVCVERLPSHLQDCQALLGSLVPAVHLVTIVLGRQLLYRLFERLDDALRKKERRGERSGEEEKDNVCNVMEDVR